MSGRTAKGANLLRGRHVPKFDRAVETGGEQLLAVAAERHTVNRFLMARKHLAALFLIDLLRQQDGQPANSNESNRGENGPTRKEGTGHVASSQGGKKSVWRVSFGPAP